MLLRAVNCGQLNRVIRSAERAPCDGKAIVSGPRRRPVIGLAARLLHLLRQALRTSGCVCGQHLPAWPDAVDTIGESCFVELLGFESGGNSFPNLPVLACGDPDAQVTPGYPIVSPLVPG